MSTTPSRRRALLGGAFALLGVAGCQDPNPTRDVAVAASGLARVDVVYTHEAGRPASELRFDAQGHFALVRPSAAARVVPTLLGAGEEAADIALDRCRATDAAAELDEALRSGPSEVRLLDAGRLELRGAPLVAAHYPEFLPSVSGVVYGGDDAHPAPLALGQLYALTGEGGEEVGPVEGSVVAPRQWPTLTVAPLRRGADLDLRWATAGTDADRADAEAARIDVRWTARGRTVGVRCRARDDGEFTVPREVFDGVPAGAPVTLTVSRVAHGALSAAGLGAGELVLELRELATVRLDGTPAP